MKIFVMWALLAFSAKSKAIDENCNGIVIHNINHSEEILKSNIDCPYQLAIDYNSDTIFFSYSSDDLTTSFKSAYINLTSNEFQIIKGINEGFANAVDSQTNTVYLGGSDGLYKFDYETNNAQHIDGTSHDIWQLFFKKYLYFSSDLENAIYVFKNGQTERVPELLETDAKLVAFDNNDNIFFSNMSGFYVFKKTENDVSYLGDFDVSGLTSDINGNLFFSTTDGIYFISDKNMNIEKLASIYNVCGVAVESDGNIIYSSQNSLVRLKSTKALCFFNETSTLNPES